MIKAVIFDMDGLLIDSEPFWRASEIKVFETYGINLTDDDCRKTTGMRVEEVVKYWAGVYPQKNIDIQKTVQQINNNVIYLVNQSGQALPGVYNTINFFKQKGLPMALASASGNNIIDAVTQKLDIKKELKIIQSAEFMRFGKPHPEIFITTADKLNVNVQNCLVFEDSVFGVIAARAALMKVVAVPEHANYNKIDYSIANHKIKSLESFNAELFEKLNNDKNI